jgi:dienelactone hydrolase
MTAGREQDFGVAQHAVTYIDKSRPIKPFDGFGGTPDRRLDLIVWHPVVQGADAPSPDARATGGPWPLVLYCHGTLGYADNATHIVRDLVQHGYVVAAPNFPLTSSAAFTRVSHADLSDVVNQTKDLSFIIDSLLADDLFGPLIDRQNIGSMGHSLGAVTNYFAVFARQTREPRIAAVALLGAGDPVQAALSNDMGFAGSWPAAVNAPVLFLSAEKDVFARMTGGPHAAYSRVLPPKCEIMINRGVHVWFRDSTEQPADNKNPDCLFRGRSARNESSWMRGTGAADRARSSAGDYAHGGARLFRRVSQGKQGWSGCASQHRQPLSRIDPDDSRNVTGKTDHIHVFANARICGASKGQCANKPSPRAWAVMRSSHSLSPQGGSTSTAPGIACAIASEVSRV